MTPPRRPRRPVQSRSSAPAFTLVEMLVVITIIAILAAIALTLGARVRDSGKARLTEQVINVLDLALSSYKADKGALPPPYTVVDGVAWPMADARNMDHRVPAPGNSIISPSTEGFAMLNSGGLFTSEMQSQQAASQALQQLDARVLSGVDIDASGTDDGPQPGLPTPLDAWGRPIRFAHAAFQRTLIGNASNASTAIVRGGSQDPFAERGLPATVAGAVWGTNSIRRNNQYTDEEGLGLPVATLERFTHNVPDSDGGSLPGRQPYFYSVGPDGRVGRLLESLTDPKAAVQSSFDDDNLYSAEVVQPK